MLSCMRLIDQKIAHFVDAAPLLIWVRKTHERLPVILIPQNIQEPNS